jgi:peptidoglycan/LPS O-acetylase OafA/YrhL
VTDMLLPVGRPAESAAYLPVGREVGSAPERCWCRAIEGRRAWEAGRNDCSVASGSLTDRAVGSAPGPGSDELRDPLASGYRPHLDGVRAVAVYLVVLFHSGVAWADGGFIGVDVFFVLSGFLVTQLLLRDIEGFGGIRLGRFYARRYRRLLPASVVVLLITAVVYSAVAAPGEAAASIGSFKAAFLYVANWHLIQQSAGYFGAAVARNPTLHFWSLAVEEQYYLVWPLLLAGLFAVVGTVRRSRVRAVIAAGAIASLVWALVLQGSSPDHAYYGTDARAYQLLTGGLLALSPGIVARVQRAGRRRVVLLGAAVLAGLLILASSALDVAPITRSALTTALAVTLIAALEAVPTGWVHLVLSSDPFVYLGKISYGIYLWHWPVILVALAVAKPSPIAVAGLTTLVATGLASASYQLLEMPVRTSELLQRHRFAVIGYGIAISVVSALILTPAILNRSSPGSSTAIASTRGFTPVPKDLNLERVFADSFGSTVECRTNTPAGCTVVRGRGPHVMLMGDSNAQMLVPAFKSFARANGLTLSLEVTAGCPWQRGMYGQVRSLLAVCRRNKQDAYKRVIPTLRPDIIVLVDRNYSSLEKATGVVAETTRTSLAQLEVPGRTLVLVEPIVESPTPPEPLQCLQRARFLEDCRYAADTAPNLIDLLYRNIADPSVVVANFDRLVCPYLPICDPVIGGVVVRWDHEHISTAYSATLGPALTDYFKGAGLIPR